MSSIRSKWTSQERLIHNYLKGNKIKHRMHPLIEGKPDILIIKSNKAIFLNGCFWHRCQKCFKEPKSNKKYWIPKIEKNVKRDATSKSLLKSMGYKVLVIWEHEIKKDMENVLRKISAKS